MEQGLSVTVIEAAHFLEAPEGSDPRRDFYSARCIWLGYVPGTDWLHEALARELNPMGVAYTLDSERRSMHAGAAGEIAIAVVVLLGARAVDAFLTKFSGRLGERSADDFYEWIRGAADERRSEAGIEGGDPPPNFFDSEPGELADAFRQDLADLLEVDPARLDLVQSERAESLALRATYRLRETDGEYRVEAGEAEAKITRVGVPEHPPESPPRKRRRLRWRRH